MLTNYITMATHFSVELTKTLHGKNAIVLNSDILLDL